MLDDWIPFVIAAAVFVGGFVVTFLIGTWSSALTVTSLITFYSMLIMRRFEVSEECVRQTTPDSIEALILILCALIFTTSSIIELIWRNPAGIACYRCRARRDIATSATYYPALFDA